MELSTSQSDPTMEGQGVYRNRLKESSFDESKEGSTPESRLKSTMHVQMCQSHPCEGYDILFWAAVLSSQVVGLCLVGLLAYWCTLYGGFSWESDADLQFNLHPLLMVLGLIFFYGDAIIVYRVLHFIPKWILKIIHAALHLAAMIMSCVGLAAVLENHKRTNKADFYSLHSWIGIATFGFFFLQYIGSFAALMFPGSAVSMRAKIMPFHVFFGVGLFAMAVATAETGLTEKLLWTENYTTNQYVKEGVIGNCIGLLIVIFAFLIIYVTTHTKYKRKPLPSESNLSVTN